MKPGRASRRLRRGSPELAESEEEMAGQIEKTDVLVIGSGAIGSSIAWRLARAGAGVLVIDRGELGAESSHAAGGMLAPLAEADEAGDFLDLCVRSREMYAEFARELREASGIDIEYRADGTLYLAFTGEDERELEGRLAWQRAAGLNVKRLDRGCVLKLEPALNPSLKWALKFPDDHQVNNRRMVAALQAAARSAGAVLIPHRAAIEVLLDSKAGRRRVTGVATDRGIIEAGTVIVAAGAWSSLLGIDDHPAASRVEVEPVRGQMVSVGMPAPAIRHVIYSCRGYVVPRFGGLLIAGSTTEHEGYDKSVTAGGIGSIIRNAAEIVCGFDRLPMVEIWAGLRPLSKDSIPLLGPDPEIDGLILATGHYRNGILLTPITARAISEIVLHGRSSIDLRSFAPGRQSRPAAAG